MRRRRSDLRIAQQKLLLSGGLAATMRNITVAHCTYRHNRPDAQRQRDDSDQEETGFLRTPLFQYCLHHSTFFNSTQCVSALQGHFPCDRAVIPPFRESPRSLSESNNSYRRRLASSVPMSLLKLPRR